MAACITCRSPIEGRYVGESDQCGPCTRQYEAEQAERGYLEAPCRNGHYTCAHIEGGACHGGPVTRCPSANPLCEALP